jgi:cytochrome c oxidase assembly factor CtaG/putative copper export protein
VPPPTVPASRLIGTSTLVVGAFLALIAALAIGGAAAALLIDDPGPVVRFGLPAAKLVVDLAVSVTVGALALVVLALGGERETGRALDLAAAAAGAWTIASALTGLLTFVSVTSIPFSWDATFGAQLGYFLTSIGAGEAWLITTLMAASVTVLCFAVRSRPALVLVLLLALAGLLPMAGEGHTAGADSHDEAVAALALHLCFAAVWLGGILALVFLRGVLAGKQLSAVVARYSSLALLSFCVVALTGYVSASLRIGSPDRLLTPYGILVVVKVVALLGLGLAGALHRRFTLRRLEGGAGRWFWALVVGELAVMGIATGTAAGLARTAPPVDETPVDATSPSALLTGEPLPPPLDFGHLLTEGRLDLVWLVAAGMAAAYYVAGVVRLTHRGERWPAARTASWLAGLLLLVAITNGGVAAYARHLFSAEMMTVGGVAVLVPLLLVPGAPLRLLLTAAEARSDGSRGVREWVELSARALRPLRGWLPATLVGIVMAWSFTFTPVLRWIVTDAAGREAGIALLLLGGLVLVSAVLRSSSRAGASAAGLVAMAWAVCGVMLVTGSALLLSDWYGAMGWSTSAIDDQRAGGAVLLGTAALPLAVLAVIRMFRHDADVPASRSPRADDDRYRAMLDRVGARRTP